MDLSPRGLYFREFIHRYENSATSYSRCHASGVAAGGGGTSSGGNYAVSGTIGQADAGGPLTGGNYSLTGGFWSGVTLVQNPEGPELSMVTDSKGGMTVRWPSPSPGYILQQSTDLTKESWADSTYPVADDGTWRSITFEPAAGRLYFRLRK